MRDTSSLHPDLRDVLRRRFPVALPEKGPDKRTSMATAIAAHTAPGQAIHIASTHTRPYALVYELIRRYWKQAPQLEVSCITLGESWVGLYTGGIVSKVTTTFAGDMWPYPSPNPAINRAWRANDVVIEHWSILSLTQRLLAAALGLPFLPTRCLLGSTMAAHNEAAGTFQHIADPFTGTPLGLVRALSCDVCFMHVPACDASGNAIMTAPLAEGPLGAFAARRGVVLTTERIVTTEFVRQYNYLVKVPADRVLAVVETPLGGHPRGQTNVGCEELDQYADDYAFMYEVRQAARQSPEALQAWIDEWILNCDSHQQFVAKLGQQRIETLRARTAPDGWYDELQQAATNARDDAGATGDLHSDSSSIRASEVMIIAAAHKLCELAQAHDLHTVLAGVGAANLSAWLALHVLRDRGFACESLAEIGYLAYEPRPADPYIFNFKNTPTCIATTDILTVLGMVVGGGGNLGSLGAAQVDRFGNINTTCIPEELHLLGSGGGNDVASLSDAVVVTAHLGSGRFKEKVDYITSPGNRVRSVVTEYGVFDKPVGQHELVLTRFYRVGPKAFATAEQAARAIADRVDWPLQISSELCPALAPTQEQLQLLRLHDPYRHFTRS